MKSLLQYTAVSVFLLLITGLLFAQDDAVDRVTVPFSNPDRPGLLEANLINGSIEVTGYDGKDVVIEARTRTRKYSRDKSREEGMKRLVMTSTGLQVEEQHNEMQVTAASHMRAVDFTIKVPRKTNLKLGTVNGGHIIVENVEGDLELNNTNGSIQAKKVSGAVVANTTNGKVEVTFDKVDPKKPMSFVTFNGRVDVTFPEGIKADVKMKSDQGEIYSDFDVKIEDRPRLIQEDTRKRGGKYKVRVESSIFGTINGGGPLYHFSTYNGSIYIRKKS